MSYETFARIGMGNAHAVLQQAVDRARTNAPIWEAQGDKDQAECSKRQGDEAQAAIDFIVGVSEVFDRLRNKGATQ